MSKRILAVDDSPSMRHMVSVTLRGAGYEVVEAADGEEALEYARGHSVDLVLADVNMPRMDGVEFLIELRKDQDLKKSIVFVMTTSGADEDKVKAYNLGVAGYILKTNPANAFLEATALLDTYWRVVEFPAG